MKQWDCWEQTLWKQHLKGALWNSIKASKHTGINYRKTIIERSLSGVTFASRQTALTKKKNDNGRILPFVTTYHSAVKNLKRILMKHWRQIQNQPLLKTIYKKPPIISYKRGKRHARKSKDIIWRHLCDANAKKHTRSLCQPVWWPMDAISCFFFSYFFHHLFLF